MNARDELGRTPLMIAASRGKVQICRLLLDAGVDIWLVDNEGNDALAHARIGDAREVVDILSAAIMRSTSPSASACALDVSSGTILLDKEPPGEVRKAAASENSPLDANAGIVTTAAPDADLPETDPWDDLDLSGWVAEADMPPPSNDETVMCAAASVQHAIGDHRPVDSSASWDDVEAFLPERAIQTRDVYELDRRAGVRGVLLRALREGSVPLLEIERLCQGQDEADAFAFKKALLLVLGDLGAETDERDEYASREEDFTILVDPVETPNEEEVLSEALNLLDNIESHWTDPMRHYMREAQRFGLLDPAEEVALAKAMEEAVSTMIGALALWPAGLDRVVEGAEAVRSGVRSLRWIAVGPRDTVPDPEGMSDSGGGGEDDVIPLGKACSDGDALREQDDVELAKEAIADDADNFFAGIGRIGMLREEATDTWSIASMRDTLRSLGLQPSFLLGLADQALLDSSGPARAFADGVRSLKAARDQFVQANLKLAYSVAKRYMGSGVLLDDLLQEANIGLVRAVDKFDWRRGYRFSTMATWWIRQQVAHCVSESALLVRLPSHAYDAAMALHREARTREAASGERPDTAELARILGLDPAKAALYMNASLPSIDIDEVTQSSNARAESDTDPLEHAASKQLARELSRLVDSLSVKSSRIVRMRFGLGVKQDMTLEEIGQRFDVSRERVRQVEAKALEQLRRLADARFAGLLTKSADRAASEHSVHGNLGASRSTPAEQGGRVDKEKAHGSAVLDRLLAKAVALGVGVDDGRPEGGPVWVHLAKVTTTAHRTLERRLVMSGFEHCPGKGYWR